MPIVDQDASGVGLLLAARSGDIEIVRSLVRQGAEFFGGRIINVACVRFETHHTHVQTTLRIQSLVRPCSASDVGSDASSQSSLRIVRARFIYEYAGQVGSVGT